MGNLKKIKDFGWVGVEFKGEETNDVVPTSYICSKYPPPA